MSIYLDYNATTPVRPEAVEAITKALATAGNPSSVHAAGRAARALVEDARIKVAALMGAPASTVVFTSGGTEANALAIDSAVLAGCKRLLISAIEHNSVIVTAQNQGVAVELWPVDDNGVVKLDWLKHRLAAWAADDGKPFAALMLANNETGVIQPVAQAAAMIRAADGWLHVDAIQAAGKIAIDSRALGADTLTISAHKIGGPQGVGALTFGPRATLSRRIHGGGQERGRRAGTENVPGIAGFGAAAEVAIASLAHKDDECAWRDAAQARLVEEAGAHVFGAKVERLPDTLSFGVNGFSSELQIMALDLAGVMVSAGSACSSGKVTPSHVLTAMGHEPLAACALRVSGGWGTTQQDWDRFVDIWLEAYARNQSRRQAVA